MKHKRQLVEYWFDKAEESLDSANSEILAGRLTFAVNRLYYAMFYAISALFAVKNLSYGKHSAVRAAFHRKFIKTSLLDKSLGRLYDELFNARQHGDYAPLIEFDKNIVDQQAHDVSKILPHLWLLIRELLDDQEDPTGL